MEKSLNEFIHYFSNWDFMVPWGSTNIQMHFHESTIRLFFPFKEVLTLPKQKSVA